MDCLRFRTGYACRIRAGFRALPAIRYLEAVADPRRAALARRLRRDGGRRSGGTHHRRHSCRAVTLWALVTSDVCAAPCISEIRSVDSTDQRFADRYGG